MGRLDKDDFFDHKAFALVRAFYRNSAFHTGVAAVLLTSVRTIARATGVSHPGVQRTLPKLENAGLIVRLGRLWRLDPQAPLAPVMARILYSVYGEGPLHDEIASYASVVRRRAWPDCTTPVISSIAVREAARELADVAATAEVPQRLPRAAYTEFRAAADRELVHVFGTDWASEIRLQARELVRAAAGKEFVERPEIVEVGERIEAILNEISAVQSGLAERLDVRPEEAADGGGEALGASGAGGSRGETAGSSGERLLWAAADHVRTRLREYAQHVFGVAWTVQVSTQAYDFHDGALVECEYDVILNTLPGRTPGQREVQVTVRRQRMSLEGAWGESTMKSPVGVISVDVDGEASSICSAELRANAEGEVDTLEPRRHESLDEAVTSLVRFAHDNHRREMLAGCLDRDEGTRG